MKKVLLIILDGWGLSPLKDGNATFLAKTPNLDWLYGNCPKTLISASGIDVGITPGESGNSEVGHLNLGSGRVVWESMPRINLAIEQGVFIKNPALTKIVEQVKDSDGSLHLIGLCSAGAVHSSLDHLLTLIKLAADQNVDHLYIHMITDGRDTAPQVAREDLKKIEEKIKEAGVGKIATVIGRFYAMDRDNHFERTSKAYNLWTAGVGDGYQNADEAIDANYRAGADDEKIGASIIDKNGVVKSGDGVIFFNFRADRERQMLRAFEDDAFSEFQREKIDNLSIVTMTQYFEGQKSAAIFPPLNMSNLAADVIEASGLRQNHIAETEKYAHVTYFFNGGEEKAHNHEKQVLVASPRVESYDKTPEMSAAGVKDKVIEAIKDKVEFILVNFANGDMVGHTGVLPAAIKAVETVDGCLGEILTAASAGRYTAVVTADHGNCEIMINPANGEINKEHTGSPVPFVVADLSMQPFIPRSGNDFSRDNLLEYANNSPTGILADVAPTVLQIMQIGKPQEMSGIDISKLI